MAKTNVEVPYCRSFVLILLVLGLDFLRSSFGKFTSGNFIQSMGPTLTKFASNNPSEAMKSFLMNASSQAALYGTLVMWGELLVALSLTVGALLVLFSSSMKQK